MAPLGTNDGAAPQAQGPVIFACPEEDPERLLRERLCKNSHTELWEGAETQDGYSEASAEWTPLGKGYAEAMEHVRSLEAMEHVRSLQSNCSFFSESLDTTPFESHRATSLEGGLRDPDATSQEDPAQLRRSLFPAMLELTEQIHTPWLEATLSGHGPDEIRCLYRSFYTEPLDLETGDPATEGGCPEAAAAEWPPAKSHKALRTIAEDATSTPPGTKMFHQHSDVQTARGDDDDLSLDRSLSAVAVLRHGERQDSIWGSAWHNTEDSHRHPGDCPISDQAILEARNVAHLLGDFGDFGIIVSSPYLRCVQTAIAIADELDLVVLLDHELGEVFGPSVFGEADPRERFTAGHAWRSRKELYNTIKDWTPHLLQGFKKPPVQRVCWQRILGHAPHWGEKIKEARHRYATRFLTYLSRGRRARKNMIVVSHGIMVQTCLKVLPSTAACDVASIPYCGGLMAGFDRSRQISKQTSTDSELDYMAHKTPSHDSMEDFWPETDFERRVSPTSEHLAQAELHGWDVHLLGVEFESAEDTPRTRASITKRYQDLLTSLKAGSFSWAQLQLLLGDLPTELPPEAFQTVGPAELSDTATQISMELFRSPPKYSPSFALEEISSELAFKEVAEEDPGKIVRVPQLSLKSSRLMGRRNSQQTVDLLELKSGEEPSH